MRKRIALLSITSMLLFISFSNLNAQVYNGDLTLTSQTEVDAFNYTSVTGTLTIFQTTASGNITNLNGLSELTTVGYLVIRGNISLTNIDGLSNLLSVGESLEIFENGALTNIDGLSGLTSVGINLRIVGNPILTGFCGLYTLLNNNGLAGSYTVQNNLANPTTQQIINAGTCPFTGYYGDLTLTTQAEIDAFNYTTVLGTLTIFQQSLAGNITNLNGLSELTSVGGSLVIRGNISLTNTDGLSNLVSVGEFLDIFENGALTNIDGLSGLTSVGGNLDIVANDALKNMDGLSGLTSVGANLRVYGNATLTGFCGLYTLLNNSGVTGSYTVQNNLANPTAQQIITAGICPFTGYYGDLTLTTQAEIDAFNYTTVLGTLTIFQHTLAGNITNLNGLSELTSVEGSLVIRGNISLTNIDGLSNLLSVGEFLDIFENGALTNIDGLSGLTSVVGNLDIVANDALKNMDGLSGVTSVGGNLRVYGNATLTGFCGLYTLLNNSGVTGSYTVQSNLANPTAQQIITAGTCPFTGYYGDLTLTTQAEIDAFNYTTVLGTLTIFQHTLAGNITNLNGLSELTSVGGSLVIRGNISLTNTDGLSNLLSVGEFLEIFENGALTNIDGLSGLTSVGSNINIAGNNALTNLDGLSGLTSAGGNLRVVNNTSLTGFCGLYTLFKNNGLSGTYTVSGNAINPTQQQIIAGSNQPPVISDVSTDAAILAPANHKMRNVTINYTSNDECAVANCSLSVTSNEPVNGTGDGDTDPDWDVVDDRHIKLRAERAANGNGRTYTITITCTDLQGNSTTKTAEVRVAHNITGPHSGNSFKVGSTVALSGEFWDKPANKHTAKWLIDENTSVKGIVIEPTANKNGKVTGSYKFTAPGVYKLQMNTIDQNNVTTYANTNGDLEAIVVIYDPNGGHTYGGGYYNSPAGALRSDPSATGKASYGFAMNYFKNSTNPKGETQFEFKVGEFEFNALNFEYLVISNSMAQFKGTGKIIGGQSGVGFTMTVTDGQLDGTGVDKIRMKIYNKNNGAIIYDNQPGASDAALPTQAVGTNSIIVISGANSSLTSANTNQKGEMEADIAEVSDGLDVIAFPNPSASDFTINIKTNKTEKIALQVVDMYGRVVEARNVNANSNIQFGDRYRPGTYFVRIVQGKMHKEIKLIKLSD